MVKHTKKDATCEKTTTKDGAPAEVSETAPAEKNVQEDTEALLKRVQADFLNYRRRTDEEKADLRNYYTSAMITKIIPIIDNFELALKHECVDKNYATGMEMIYKLFLETLKTEGVEQVNPAGEVFDTLKHEAINTTWNPAEKEDIVLEVITKGYGMKGKMLRRARVVVNKKNIDQNQQVQEDIFEDRDADQK